MFNQKNISWFNNVHCNLEIINIVNVLKIGKGLKTFKEKKNVNIKVEFSMTFIIYEVSSKRSNALSDL